MEFPNLASEFVFYRTYARWIDELCRRESYEESVDRFIEFIEKHSGNKVPQKVFRKIKSYLLSMDVMPSMRLLWSAGKAVEVNNVCAYNCSFVSVSSIEAFAECLYILMCGTGVGFSVEKKYTDKLPEIPTLNGKGAGERIIEDSREGWADSVKHLMQSLYSGYDIEFDYSKLRPKGARLKTFGGRSSGPAPLINLHTFIRNTFEGAQGRKLKPIECHDIMNKIAEIVVVGGTRRSSQISLSDLDDLDMANAKTGNYPLHRAMSNNSVIYHEKPGAVRFIKEWAILAESGTGERGMFNLEGAKKRMPDRRNSSKVAGANPCCEILLRDCEFCNLSEIVIKEDDDLDDLLDKLETAIWIGAIQSTLTYFPYLNSKWKRNCEEERLLGVSLSGQFDNISLLSDEALKEMKKKALKIAKHAAKLLDINVSVSITCTKPSGTVSQVVNCSSGLHPRFSKYYIRRYRIAAIDPLYKMMKDQGISFDPEVGQRESDWKLAQEGELTKCAIYEKGKKWTEDKVQTWVVSFPIKSPEKSVTKDELTAIQQLEHYKKIQTYWCEHNASATIYVKENEWLEVGNWVYQNWKFITGVSFLPFDGGKYELAPYQEINKEQYEKMLAEMPKIDYSKLVNYEVEDNTEGAKSYSCVGDKCELSV